MITRLRILALALALALLFPLATPSAMAQKSAGAAAATPAELRLPDGRRVWVYLPATAEPKLACVLVPPAGSRMFHGMALGEGDRAEHVPYAAAGFAVVSFDMTGPWPESGAGGVAAQQTAIKAFIASKCGVN